MYLGEIHCQKKENAGSITNDDDRESPPVLLSDPSIECILKSKLAMNTQPFVTHKGEGGINCVLSNNRKIDADQLEVCSMLERFCSASCKVKPNFRTFSLN